MRPDASLVREWAREQGLEVGQRGRLSHQLFELYARREIRVISPRPQPGTSSTAVRVISARRA